MHDARERFMPPKYNNTFTGQDRTSNTWPSVPAVKASDLSVEELLLAVVVAVMVVLVPQEPPPNTTPS